MNVWPDFVVSGWQYHCDPYWGSGDFERHWHEAIHEDGRSVVLHVSDFAFQMTMARFSKLVANDFPRNGKNPWTNETLDAMPYE